MYGERLRTLREASNFTQKDVADRIDENELQVWRFENNKMKKPNADFVVKIATLFHVSTDYLLGLADNPTPSGFITTQLSSQERAVLAAIRRNEPLEAIKAIVGN